MTRDQLISDVCDVITRHQVDDGGNYCSACIRKLYGDTHSMTLSRHRAEKIVDMLQANNLVRLT